MINRLDVYREGQLLTSFDIDENTIYSDKLQREVLITCPVAAEQALPLQENDYIEYDEELFVINTLPEFEKDGAWTVRKYNIVFEAELFHLLDTFVLDSFGKAVFSYYASANGHLQMMAANANRNGFDWQVEEVDETIEVNIDYNWTYVRTALDQIAEALGLEWKIKGKKMRMVKSVGRDTGLTFEVGRSKGLHQIKRTSDASKSRPTRVWGVGGSRNIDANYRDGAEKTLIFEGRYVETPGVTAGTERVKESKYVNEDIYPHFKGTVGNTSVFRNVNSEIISFTIIDVAIDFDINAQLAETSKEFKAKVGFLTGPLTGVEFEISKYDHATRAVTIIPNTDTNGYVLPNDLNMPEIGNKFTFYDFKMPQPYYTNAEKELKDKTLEFLNDGVSLTFSAKPDEKHLRDNDIRLRSGDRATVIEADINVNEVLRFTEISFPLVNPYNVTTVISSEIRYDKVVKLFADVIQTKQQLYTVERRNIELEKRAIQNLRAFELSVFDTDGMFDSEKLNVGVLSAALGIYGTKSQNFKLSKVYITDNYQYDPSKVYISGGELIHFEYANGSQNIWQMQPLTQTGLVATSLYYVYAKCNKASQVGSFVATTSQIKVEEVAGFYHFLMGVIYPVNNGYRDSEFSNGIADINGNRLKIGKVVSRDGLTGFDLDNNTIFGNIRFRSAQGVLTSVESAIGTAKTEALTTAATDSQQKANNAYTTAVAASNAYAALYADMAASDAEIAAAADATAKATAAYNDAVAAAAAAYSNLTNSLKSLAYQDLVDLAVNGETLITGGKINTILLDAAAIRANIINADFVKGLEIDFTKGTIGGFKINESSIQGDGGQLSGIGSSIGVLEINNGPFPEIIMRRRQLVSIDAIVTTLGLRLHSMGAEANTIDVTRRLNIDENATVNIGDLTGKSGYILISQNSGTSYNGIRVKNGLIVGAGAYNTTNQPIGLT